MIWAGQHVEPRILEVLPAAFLRLRKHFLGFDPKKNSELQEVVSKLAARKPLQGAFFGVPLIKIAQWLDFPLRDGRVKPLFSKKVVKTFRLAPTTIAKLAERAQQWNGSETEALERIINAAC